MTLRPPVSLHDYYGSTQTAAPATEPVTAAELRAHLIVDSTQLPDDAANALITDARTEIENRLNIAMITQSWRFSIDRWPGGAEAWWDGVRQMAASELYGRNALTSLNMPRFPLQSITSVTVYDEDSNAASVNVAQTFDVDTRRTPGRITLKNGATWPVALRANNAIEIVYVAGYGSAAQVPAPLKRAVRDLAAYLYSHRGDGCDPSEAFNMSGAATATNVYKVFRI